MVLLEIRDNDTDLFIIAGALYGAVIFLGVTNCSTVQPVVAVERTVFYRERAAGMYSAMPYALAQVGSLACQFVPCMTTVKATYKAEYRPVYNSIWHQCVFPGWFATWLATIHVKIPTVLPAKWVVLSLWLIYLCWWNLWVSNLTMICMLVICHDTN